MLITMAISIPIPAPRAVPSRRAVRDGLELRYTVVIDWKETET
jgi:hypothetical protein